MRIGYLGAGTWGFSLACLLADKGYDVTLWTADEEKNKFLKKKREHPKLPNFKAPVSLKYTSDLEEVLQNKDLIIESVTSKGVRPICEQMLIYGALKCPFVITSKGIEQDSSLLLPEVAIEVFGQQAACQIVCLSGPSHAEEVIQKLPTSIVSASQTPELMQLVADVFATPFFRVYPNSDLRGVAFGGAMKNIIGIACGISDGLGFGDNAKAALMTRGLHEIRKLAITKGCRIETLSGLSGLGDLCVTCLSCHSRNYRFGRLIAEGLDPEVARDKIGMVVEGAYTCVSALQLGKKHLIPLPITEAVYSILYEALSPHEAVKNLFQRVVKEEHL